MVYMGWRSYAPSTINESGFYIKTVQLANNGKTIHEIFVTNYIKLWKMRFTEEEILKIMLESNKGVEVVSEASFMQNGFQILADLDNICEKTITESSRGSLNVAVLRKTPYVLKMNFTLTLCSAQEFCLTITRPMLSIIDDLKESETALRNLIKKKDFELEEYFRETNNVYSMMKCFTTPKYDDKSHMSKHNTMADHFGNETDSDLAIKPKDILKSLPPSLLQNQTISSVLNQNIKMEPGTNTLSKTDSVINPLIKTDMATISPIKTESVAKTEPIINKPVKTEPEVNIITKTEPEINTITKTETETPQNESDMRLFSQTLDQANPGEFIPTSPLVKTENTQNSQSPSISPRNRIEPSQSSRKKRKKLNY